MQVNPYTSISKNVARRKAKRLSQDRKVIWDFYNDLVQVVWQPRPQGAFPWPGEVGWEKAVASATRMTSKHPEFVGVLN